MSGKRRDLRLIAVPAFLSLLLSCRTAGPPLEARTGPLRFGLVFVVHGDGSYLFHDGDGKPQEADRVALERARAAAEANPEAEVFVFHQHERRGLARENGTLELYRNGALVLRKGYRRSSGGMEAEIAIHHDLSRLGSSAGLHRLFLYFGHQIPELPQPGYHDSIPRATFGLEQLADGLAGFLPVKGRFDLVVLSTCNNGTPTAVAALAPRARYLLASPADLHLSHLSTETLRHLEQRAPMEVGLLARELGLAAFQELTERVSTIVTVAVYDLDELAPRISQAAAELRVRLAGTEGPLEFCDCGEDPRLSWLADLPGVTIYYRPPRFGRERNKQTHSGLECFR